MSDDARTSDRSFVAAQILALEAHRREVQNDLDHLRSVLRNDLAGQRWSDDTVRVEFRPGFYRAVPARRLPTGGLIFRRRRLEPYMKVSAK
jgi:hypothetical protein